MNLRKVINRRIRRKAAGIDLQGDVNAVVAANVGERAGSTSVSSRQTVVRHSHRAAAARGETKASDRTAEHERDRPDDAEARRRESMTEKPTTKRDVSDEELEAQDGEELPDRETMMILDPGPDFGFGGPDPYEVTETPDDRYEQ